MNVGVSNDVSQSIRDRPAVNGDTKVNDNGEADIGQSNINIRELINIPELTVTSQSMQMSLLMGCRTKTV